MALRFVYSLLFFVQLSWAYSQPSGYYDNAQGLAGEQMRTALHNIIKNHNVIAYSDVWSHFPNLDKKPNGKVWDIYSDNPGGTPAYEYTLVTDQCGQYSGEGDCYNREHTVPASWYNSASPMYSDLFQVYPTDGFVNGKRSNLPYGETSGGTWMSTNGSNLGNHLLSGYSGIVFEPIDEYKGDLARTYFYMVTRYMDVVTNWTSDMFTGNTLSSWALDMLMDWDANDPVSQKEIARNEAIYLVQNNRNPFIDNPTYVLAIWDSTYVVGLRASRHSENRIWYANGKLYFNKLRTYAGKVLIYNSIGQLVLSVPIKNNIFEYPLALPQGMYVIRMSNQDEKGNILTNKFLVFR
ncbi:MAG: endonuclease I [Flavobacteriales bacterium]|nr:MAG: endonuclease I [Flavobacteriales bacterium]